MDVRIVSPAGGRAWSWHIIAWISDAYDQLNSQTVYSLKKKDGEVFSKESSTLNFVGLILANNVAGFHVTTNKEAFDEINDSIELVKLAYAKDDPGYSRGDT